MDNRRPLVATTAARGPEQHTAATALYQMPLHAFSRGSEVDAGVHADEQRAHTWCGTSGSVWTGIGIELESTWCAMGLAIAIGAEQE